MFDINWDEEPERVGERRARKELERGLKKKSEDGSGSVRESASVRSSISSTEKSSGIFGSIGLKITNASLRAKRGSPNMLQPSKSNNPKRVSILSHSAFKSSEETSQETETEPEDLGAQATNTPKACPDVSIVSVEAPPDRRVDMNRDSSTFPSDDSTYRSSKGSEYSKLTKVTTPVSLSPPTKTAKLDLMVPAEGDTSQTPDASSRSSNVVVPILAQDDSDATRSPDKGAEVEVSEPEPLEDVLTALTPLGPVRSVSTSEVIDKWFKVIQNSENNTPLSLQNSATFNNDSPITASLKPPTAEVDTPTRLPRVAKTPSCRSTSVSSRVDSPSVWKTPGGWSGPSIPLPPTPVSSLRRSNRKTSGAHALSLDLFGMQREIVKMTSASAKIVTARLNEDWGKSNDAAFFRELEMEKKRWMLSALYKMHRPVEVSDVFLQEKRVLALFESQATASYLAACQPNAILTHIGTDPLSATLFPNVRPILSSICVNLPLPANTFTAAHSLSLPSLMPGKDIPRVLKNLHRCLAPKGKLYLTLIDPSPASQSVGPKMRNWLDQNLLLNIEAGFRCISPTRLFPAWLADARLRANDSVIAKVKFEAICQSKDGNGEGMETPEAEYERVDEELRSTVGRKLWQEVWGHFVHGKAWWWDDSECVEECLRLSTYFEISFIEAIKDTV